MGDYISRGLAMQAVMSAAMEREDYLTNPCIGALGKVPTVDAVEVVRCKDCDYSYIRGNPFTGDPERVCNFGLLRDRVADEHYCSHGYKKG